MRAAFIHVSRWTGRALSVLLIAMVLLVCVGVALRYVWGVSLLWADELLVQGLVAITFLGAVRVSVRGEHLRMNLVSDLAGQRLRAALDRLEQAVIAATCLFVAWHSLQVVLRFWRSGTRSNMADMPMWLLHGLVLVGLVGMATVALARLLGAIGRNEQG